MSDWAGKRYWLIGASQGLGRALAHILSGAGAEVIVSARDAGALNALVATLPGRAQAVPCDVRDLASLSAAADQIGKIDGMVFLAGVYWPMAATALDGPSLETMGDVNFTGALRAVGVVVPRMVAQKSGHIVLTGSLSGFRGLPGAVGYGASKAGIMSLAESLRVDLRGSGVQVQLVNPGFIRTRLTDKNDFKMPFLMEPEAAAHQIFDHMATRRFACSYPRPFAWLFRLAALLPDWAYFRIFA